MANNKVQLADGTTLIDLTSDTVTPQTMLAGATAHAANGEQITGVVNLANAGTATPLPDGRNASVGSSNDYAREDHRHPIADGVMFVVSDNPLISSDDLDTVTRVGLYRIGGTQPANCPSGVTWSVLMVSSVGTTRLQTIFNTDGTKFNIYQRNGNSNSWNAWKKISLSDITTLQTDVSSLQSNVSTLQTDVGTNQTNIGNLQTAVSNLQNDVSDNSADIADLKAAVENIVVVTPTDIHSHFQLVTYSTKTLNDAFLFGSVTLKCVTAHGANDGEAFKMPTKAAYDFQPVYIMASQWARDALRTGRAYYATSGNVALPDMAANEYATIFFSCPL